jgi:hypothetical protein
MMTTPIVRVSQTGMKSREKASPVEVDAVAPLEKSDGRKERAATLTMITTISSIRRGEDFFVAPYPCELS